MRPSARQPKVPEQRRRWSKDELPGVDLTCGTCGKSFPARQYSKRTALANFCTQACRLAWSRRVFNPDNYSRKAIR